MNDEDTNVVLARFEERQQAMADSISRLEALIVTQNNQLTAELVNYVRREVFEPVRILVFGLVGMALAAVTTGVLTLVVA